MTREWVSRGISRSPPLANVIAPNQGEKSGKGQHSKILSRSSTHKDEGKTGISQQTRLSCFIAMPDHRRSIIANLGKTPESVAQRHLWPSYFSWTYSRWAPQH